MFLRCKQGEALCDTKGKAINKNLIYINKVTKCGSTQVGDEAPLLRA